MRVASHDVLLLFAAHLLADGAAACSCHKFSASPGSSPRTPECVTWPLLAGDGFARAPRERVGASALAAYGQATAGGRRPCRNRSRPAPDVGGNLATEVTFDLIVGLDPAAKRNQMLVGQLVDVDVTTDLGGLEGLQERGSAYAVDVGEGDPEALVARRSTPMRRAMRQVLPSSVDAGLRGCALDKLRRS
jgi:hypothetical protein